MTAPVAKAAVTSPAEKVTAAMRWAPVCATRVASTAASMRSAVRACTPYARMTGAPTTDSATAPSISPTRTRTAPYARCRCCWKVRTANTSGRKHR